MRIVYSKHLGASGGKHPKVKFYYFPAMGRPEPIRMLMTHVGMQFENIGIPFPDWPAFKAKIGGGGMPVMEWPDGRMMQQTVPMAIYVGKYHGIHPNDPFEGWVNDAWT